MDNTNLDLSCPCMPQCPNYGKCRECIAAHAQYYTVPHCIKAMQEDMKKNVIGNKTVITLLETPLNKIYLKYLEDGFMMKKHQKE